MEHEPITDETWEVRAAGPLLLGWTCQPDIPMHLFAALAAVQAEVKNPPKDRTAVIGPNRSYDYSDLASVLDTVRPVLAKHKLAVTQWPSVRDGWGYITTVLTWSDGKEGEYMVGTCGLPLGDMKPQTLGSMQTYLRRYSLNAVCGVAGDADDDASVAQGVQATTMPRTERPTAPPREDSDPRTITEPQAKFLKVELSKNSVTAKETVTWYNERFGATAKTPLDFLRSRFDDVLAWVREGESVDVDQQGPEEEGDLLT